MSTLVIYCDGACQPANPGGWACWAWVAMLDGGILDHDHGCIGHGPGMTNQVAEYGALEHALRWATEIWVRGVHRDLDDDVIIRTDSQLVVHQVNGKWGCHAEHLLPLRDRARAFLHELEDWQAGSVRLEWVPRTQNTEADALAHQAYLKARARAPYRGPSGEAA